MHLGEGVDTSGAADEYLAVVLGVEVDEPFGTEHAILQFHGAGEACLLIDGEEALDSGVLQFGIGDSRERHGDTDTVVRAERRAFGFEPLAVHIRLNGVFEKIMLYVTVFLGYHVHVGLQDDAFMVLVPFRSGHTHDDVHRLVGDTLNTVSRSEVLQPATDLLLMFGRTGNFTYLRENLKYIFTLGHFHIYSFFSFFY